MKKLHRITILSVLVAACVAESAERPSSRARKKVLVELFTSQG